MMASVEPTSPAVTQTGFTIVFCPSEAGRSLDPIQISRQLGAPHAATVVLRKSPEEPVQLLAEAVEQSRTEWVILVDDATVISAELFNAQTKQCAGRCLDACLPMADPLVYEPSPQGSWIAGTVFRREALQRALTPRPRSESHFWVAFAKVGSIGALPPSNTIARPGQAETRTKSKLSPGDLAAALIDRDWYRNTYRDVAKARVDPVEHYVRYGWRERRDPNAWFSTAWYIDQNPEAGQSDTGPLLHFASFGDATAMWSRPGFDLRWAARRYLGGKPRTFGSLLAFFLPGLHDIAARAQLDPKTVWEEVERLAPEFIGIVRKLQLGELSDHELLDRLIDRDWYLRTYTDVAAAKVDPVEHYFRYGWRERRDPNPWFSTGWYLDSNADAREMDRPALEHFTKRGAAAGRQPHPGFYLRWYVRRYLPGSPLSADALLHFLTTGAKAGAVPDPRLDRADVAEMLQAVEPALRPARIRELQAQLPSDHEVMVGLIDREWYWQSYPDVAQAQFDPVSHYLQHGWLERRDPNPWFDTSWYLEQNPAVDQQCVCPLLHYVQAGAADGCRPSPGFDTAWYSARYLRANSPSADALGHFLRIGISNGAVPEGSLDRADILRKVSACPVQERTALLQRLRLSVAAEEDLLLALVDTDWYTSGYSGDPTALVNAAAHYREKGWREGRNPNRWFDTRWYLDEYPSVVDEDICPLDHYVHTGAASGFNPHPLFDTRWYASHYLSGAKPSAEALRHFMTIGLPTGAVPDGRIVTPAVQQRLRETPESHRPEVIQRLIELLERASGNVLPLLEPDKDLWPLLLARNIPASTLPVLLICHADARERAAGAAMALPPEEAALFGVIESGDELRITDRLDSEAVGVRITLPKQTLELKALFLALRCRRAAAIGPNLLDTPIVRSVRNAGMPVFTNGSAL